MLERWLGIWDSLLRHDVRVTSLALGAIAIVTLLEWWIPAEPGQGVSGRARNLVYLLIFKVLGLGAVALWYGFGPAPMHLGQAMAPASLDGGSALVAAGWVLANLVVSDLFYYFYHRAQHRFAPIWAIHELHHADEELNATTSYRTYWLESVVQLILVATPTYFFFGHLGAEHVQQVVFFLIFFLIFGHCNLRLSLGPLTGVLCGPQVHRIHHSRLPEHQDKNFAQLFPLIDRIFGTYYAPAKGEFPPTGAAGLASDASIGRAMVQPFQSWGRMLGLGRAGR